jgi:hypothetical protein
MKQFLILVMIISLLTTAVLGCSNGLVSGKDDLSGGEIPTQETKPETSPGQIEPEKINSDDTDGQGQNEPKPPEEEKPEENQTEIKTPEVEQPEVVPPIKETPEVIPPDVKPPVDPPIVEPPEVETPETEPPIVAPQETEPPEIIPPIVPQNDVKLVINELRTEFSSTAKRAEYIEFKVTQEGNLNGISVHIMFDAKKPFVYNFPAVNVSLGEYITLHLRTIENDCIDELGDNLTLSGGVESCPTARDLWVKGSEKYLHKSDIVYLQDASGKIIDAIIMNEKPSATWNNSQSHFQGIAEYLCNVGAWESADGEKPTAFDAVDTSSIGSSMYKSVCRYEWRQNHFNTSDWYVTPTSPTPGLPNKQ